MAFVPSNIPETETPIFHSSATNSESHAAIQYIFTSAKDFYNYLFQLFLIRWHSEKEYLPVLYYLELL
jgi:hypothetical protein